MFSSADLSQKLQQSFGFSQFRPGQEQTISQLLDGNSSLAIFPTGSGKSLCYQFTALQLPHLTLVVSPLLALMQDQVAFLREQGIACASIDSSLTPQQNQQVMADAKSGALKILMVSVERFKNERFRRFISQVNISMLVVDEAHCISEWGHNFRPNYLKLPLYCQQLNVERVLLLTATATKKVKLDMAAKFNIKPEHIVQTGFYRANLDLSVIASQQASKQQDLLQLLQQPQQQGCGIVYVTQQESAETIARFLQQQGYDAKAYHAGMASESRQLIQQQFMQAPQQIIVATIAFGMGIDKADIRFVIHYDLPKSIENYSQEIGRAGRDGLASNCYVLASLDSLNMLENFVYGDTPAQGAISIVLDDLAQTGAQWELQLYHLSQQADIRQSPLKTLLVQLELAKVIKPLFSYFAEYQFKFLQPKEQVIAGFNAERQVFLSSLFEACPGKKVWHQLDLNLCQGKNIAREKAIATLEYLHEQKQIELVAKKMTEAYQVNTEVLAQQQNLAQQLSVYFADNEASEIKRIGALIRFLQLDRCLSANLAAYFDDQQAPKQCGHCSACRAQPAVLTQVTEQPWPSEQLVRSSLTTLKQEVQALFGVEASLSLQCRFLAGIASPWLTKVKAKKIPGFASCAQQNYAQIKAKLQALSI